jgi:hypothetical protein
MDLAPCVKTVASHARAAIDRKPVIAQPLPGVFERVRVPTALA